MGLRRCGACFLLYIYFIGINGSRLQSRFIETNRDLLLTVKVQLGREDIFFWKFTNNNIIRLLEVVKFIIFPNYKDRVEFIPHNLSLILKKVQLSDSGIYTAEVSGEKNEIHATYNVTVEAPVSPVSVSVDSVRNSSDSCNFTVHCSSDHSSISRSFTCDRHTCEEPRPLTPDPAPSLHLYLSNLSIVCNHSNHVSWTHATKNYHEICQKAEDTVLLGNYLTPVLVTVAVIVLVLAVFGVAWKIWSERKMVENTVYEVAQCSHPEPARNADTESPTSTYSEVQPHTGPVPAPAQNIESLYSTVNKSSTPDLLSLA